ncbi:hypothetical protein N7510_004082 [Penicillium lagena]|uniref:uncharacterized protein n=1 Tax=Penicillium lagena TaxID=94218 RepID=UPI0025415750|nr:uncharacterized protein N7510_004082 [Penicillium lagena]KAJ5620098.1 hypothetical protein N7510_004082 [Penicillium lagena]
MNSVNEKHPVQKAFPFIAYASSYGSCEDEKARNRIFVRSYAAQKRIYPGTDVLDGPSQKNPKDTRGILQNARRSVTAMDPVLLPLSSALRPKDSSGYEIQPPSDHWDRFNERSRRPVKASPKKPNKVTKECIFPPAEIEYLAMGAMDPFRTYPLRNLPQGTFEECFDYSTTSCQPITDSLILSALCMANNSSSGDIVSKNGASSFRPPLRQLQWLDIYATASFNATYHMGLYHLIQLRGGLESIELPGLATIISL